MQLLTHETLTHSRPHTYTDALTHIAHPYTDALTHIAQLN